MPRTYLGVIKLIDTGTIISVINPTDDSELDNPRLLDWKNADGERINVELIKVPRGRHIGLMTPDDLAEFVESLKG